MKEIFSFLKFNPIYFFSTFFGKGSFSRNVLILLTGTGSAQLITFIALPFLSRVYTPIDYGVLSLYIAIVSFVGSGATGKYESAIMLPAADDEAINILILSLFILFSVSLISGLALLLIKTAVPLLLADKFSNWFYFAPLSIFLLSLTNTLNFWENRNKRYKWISAGKLANSSINSIISLLLGLMGLGAGGLILGSLAGQLVNNNILGYGIWKETGQEFSAISKLKILGCARKYQGFPKFNMPQTLLDNFRTGSIFMLITYYFCPTVLGHYAFGMTIAQTPFSLVGTAISQVFYQKLAETFNAKQNLWAIQKKLIQHLALFSSPLFLILAFYGTPLFRVFFGPNWAHSGFYVQILCPYLFISFIASTVSAVPLVLGKQREYLFWGCGYNLLLPLAFLLCALVKTSFPIALGAISLSGSLYLIAVIFWVRRISSDPYSAEKQTPIDLKPE